MTGELSLRPHNTVGRISNAIDQLIVVRKGAPEVRRVRAFKPVLDGYLVRLVGVDDREAAAALTHAEVRVARTLLPPLGRDEYYVGDVVGCLVENEAGRTFGRAREIFWNGAHDVASVVDDGGRERLIPLLPQFVVAADTANRKLRVRWEEDD